MISLLIFIAIVSSRLTNGQVVFGGGCPAEVTAIQDFDASQYVGTWYEAERYFSLFEIGGQCVKAVYEAGDNGTVKVTNSQINSITKNPASIEGEATFAESSNIGKLSVTFPSSFVPFAAPYWIIGTDYTSYAVVWSCVDLQVLHTVNVWVLTRDQIASDEVLEKAHAVLDSFSISRKYLSKTVQDDCASS